jgi:uncharacterized protein (DUF58 family)
MIFTRRFLILLLTGAVATLILWSWPRIGLVVALFDLALLVAAFIDYRRSGSKPDLEVSRRLPNRMMIGVENQVVLDVRNHLRRKLLVEFKDEYPPELDLRGERTIRMRVPSRGQATQHYALFSAARGDYQFGDVVARWEGPWRLSVRQVRFESSCVVKIYPNVHEARKNSLLARRNEQPMSGLRRARIHGQSKEFESLRDYVDGDELRLVSWKSTARRGRLMTKQYQVERNQNVIVMLDAGRLMTSRIGSLSKLDHAIAAALSIAYLTTRAGDNFGLLVFARTVLSYLPPRRGAAQLHNLLETLHNVRPEMVEPSYVRAFQSFSRYCKRRSLVIILTDLIDSDSSAELLAHTSTLLPRHLPLIATIGDRDLLALRKETPAKVEEVYRLSVAEELLRQRSEALARITELGGLALDVPAGKLSGELINRYLDVKARGLL